MALKYKTNIISMSSNSRINSLFSLVKLAISLLLDKISSSFVTKKMEPPDLK